MDFLNFFEPQPTHYQHPQYSDDVWSYLAQQEIARRRQEENERQRYLKQRRQEELERQRYAQYLKQQELAKRRQEEIEKQRYLQHLKQQELAKRRKEEIERKKRIQHEKELRQKAQTLKKQREQEVRYYNPFDIFEPVFNATNYNQTHSEDDISNPSDEDLYAPIKSKSVNKVAPTTPNVKEQPASEPMDLDDFVSNMFSQFLGFNENKKEEKEDSDEETSNEEQEQESEQEQEQEAEEEEEEAESDSEVEPEPKPIESSPSESIQVKKQEQQEEQPQIPTTKETTKSVEADKSTDNKQTTITIQKKLETINSKLQTCIETYERLFSAETSGSDSEFTQTSKAYTSRIKILQKVQMQLEKLYTELDCIQQVPSNLKKLRRTLTSKSITAADKVDDLIRVLEGHRTDLLEKELSEKEASSESESEKDKQEKVSHTSKPQVKEPIRKVLIESVPDEEF